MDKNTLTKTNSFSKIILTIILTLIGSVVFGFFIQQNQLLSTLDSNLYILIHNLPHPPIVDTIFYIINYNIIKGLPYNIPTYLYLLNIIFLGYLFIFKRSVFAWALFCVLVGTTLTLFTAALDYLIVFRERPFITLPNTVPGTEIEAIKLFSSYPSGHARETVLYATLIASFIPKIKWIIYLLAIIVSFSRVYFGFHYPFDVIAGAIIGFVIGKTVLIISKDLQIIFNRNAEKKDE